MKNLAFVLMVFLIVSCATTKNESVEHKGLTNKSESKVSALQALDKLKNNPDAKFRVTRGWTVVNINTADEKSIYSFTPESHPAYPSIVKRETIEQDGSIYIDMSVNCNASKKACDSLVQQFVSLNNKVKESLAK